MPSPTTTGARCNSRCSRTRGPALRSTSEAESRTSARCYDGRFPNRCRGIAVKKLAASLALALLLPFIAAAEQKQAPLEDPFLENLVGKWKIERKIRGTLVANTLETEWVLQHRFLQLRMRDVANPPKYEALVLVGWDPTAERYVAHWCDTYGGGYSAIGYGKRDGNSLEFKFEYADGPFYNTFYWEPGERGWTMVLENTDKD